MPHRWRVGAPRQRRGRRNNPLDALDGLRLEAMLTLKRKGACIAYEEGEVLLRPYGISGGIAAFQPIAPLPSGRPYRDGPVPHLQQRPARRTRCVHASSMWAPGTERRHGSTAYCRARWPHTCASTLTGRATRSLPAPRYCTALPCALPARASTSRHRCAVAASRFHPLMLIRLPLQADRTCLPAARPWIKMRTAVVTTWAGPGFPACARARPPAVRHGQMAAHIKRPPHLGDSPPMRPNK